MNHPSPQSFWFIVATIPAVLAVSLLPYVISAPSERAAPSDRSTGHAEHEKGSGGHTMGNSPGAATAAYDLQFIDTMIPHHRAAIEMARLAKSKAGHVEVRKLADEIVLAQQREISQMQAWRTRWYKGRPHARNMDLPGMKDSMKDMSVDKLKQASGKDFDVMFLEMMIPHHQGAIVLAEDAKQNAMHPEVKQLADRIMQAQGREIDQMTKWKDAWTSPA